MSNRRSILNGILDLNGLTRIFAFLFPLALILLLTAPRVAEADSGDVYLVGEVEVDEIAGTAAAARERALAVGHQAAFGRLVDRLVPTRQVSRLPVLEAAEIAPFVRSFGIDEEKTSDIRYLGRLTFRFRRDEVREFLRANGVAFAETRSKPVLVLPVYDSAGALLLWDKPNPWFSAWTALARPDGLVPRVVPVGDLADIRDISAEQVVAAETDRIDVLAERYGANSVAAVRAGLVIDAASGDRSLEVSIRYFSSIIGERTSIRSFSVDDGEQEGAVIVRAAQAVAKQIEDDWKNENLLRFDRSDELVAIVSLSGLRDWVELRARLRSIALLRQVRVVSISRRELAVRLGYYGDPEQLRIAMAQRDLVLEQGSVHWTLKPATAPDGFSPEVPQTEARESADR